MNLKEKGESIRGKIDELDILIEESNQKIQSYNEICIQLNQIKSERNMVSRNMEELTGTLQREMTETDEELKLMLERHRMKGRNFGNKISDYEAKKLIVLSEIGDIKGVLERQFSERGIKFGNLQVGWLK